MALSADLHHIPTASIRIDRPARQRRTIDTTGLRDSIARLGVINPIVVTRDFVLVAGERRLQCCRELGLPSVPCRFADELSPVALQIIELEENVKRCDLHWKDEVKALAKIHELYVTQDPSWAQTQTAEAIGVSDAHVSAVLRVARSIEDPRIEKCTGISAAANVLSRLDSRVLDSVMTDIIDAGATITGRTLPPAPVAEGRPIVPAMPPDAILTEDFLRWAPAYSGPRFNFVHCDFPYGIKAFAGPMSGRDKWTTYDDSPDVYWALIDCLCVNADRLLAPSAHLMFWFSMEHYTKTLEAFHSYDVGWVFDPFPLVWAKTDNVGILPDANRGPRRVYETALLARREDRRIAKPVANFYGAPTDKAHHPSAKPEPMLKHFFQMFVDETTRMLDPTCGGGSSVRACEALGGEALGLEISEEHSANARTALRSARSLRLAARAVR